VCVCVCVCFNEHKPNHNHSPASDEPNTCAATGHPPGIARQVSNWNQQLPTVALVPVTKDQFGSLSLSRRTVSKFDLQTGSNIVMDWGKYECLQRSSANATWSKAWAYL
jgi:hypothetical protein